MTHPHDGPARAVRPPPLRSKSDPTATADTDGPAGARLGEILALVETATPATIAEALPGLYTPENLARDTLGRRIGAVMDWRARGGFEVVAITARTPATIEAVVRLRLSDEHWRLAVEVEPDPPHRVAALLLGRAPLPVTGPPASDAAAARAVLDHVARLADADLFSGAVLVGRHGRVLAEGAFGLANRDFSVPNTLGTRFNVASLTKSWTAVAICQLIEAGRLSLDDPLSRFLCYPDRESAERIRIRHLLSHTSGLGTYFNDAFDATPRGRVRDLDDFLALARDDRPAFEPGTAWHYSNIGMILLGKVIEAVTGTDYHSHVTEHVLRAAGMESAGFVELDHVNPGIAVGYHTTWTTDGPVVTNALFEWAVRGAPDGCGYATVRDIWAFAEALRGGRLVSPGMVEAMTRAKPELASPDYGYGFAIHPERALFGHSGGLIGASANLDITRAPDGWVIVVLANDLSMRAPVLKARQIVGVTVPEAEEGRAYLPRAGMTAR
ncbi:serine hydrolase domain-containing protein [Roseospira navarrensis]|uniref:Serine hydrolase n=1 Tax=Roseospira navarrensis TaxID=140058 RepID=A0A7X2D464_9PROT|nr:serine hydrolase domain-containing protein [Roseospira navarrensis]MQX38094.1 serine hydrolase [Roseospira navarrensis]